LIECDTSFLQLQIKLRSITSVSFIVNAPVMAGFTGTTTGG
jgi:hypothetical protein